jgi:membrane protein DedA with SNARE-associated domain
MSPYVFLFRFIQGALATTLGTGAAIVIGTFILEDATMVAVGVMAADRQIAVPLALASLATGIALGDFGLYGIGRLAARFPLVQRWVNTERLRPIRAWLNDKLYVTVVTTRFMPGMRLPTYLACGFFAVPFRRFAIPVMGATVVWCALLFTCAYWFGVYTLSWLGIWQWPIALGAVFVLMMVGRARWKQALAKSGTAHRE